MQRMQQDLEYEQNNKQSDDMLFDYQTENDQDSLGVRDLLLIKCKSVIQDLHQEMANLKQDNKDLEDRIHQLEEQNEEKDKQIRQSIYQNENIVDEFQNERAQVQMLLEKSDQLEKELLEYKQNEEAIVSQLEELTITNNQMKSKVQELTQELDKRDHIAHEWHSTMQSVSNKIQELDKENQQLTQERNQMLLSLEKISPRNNRLDQLRNNNNNNFDGNIQNQHNLLNEWLQQTVENLQSAIRDNESKNQNIDQLQKENLNLKNNNMTLQRALEKNQHLLNQQNQLNINQQQNNNNVQNYQTTPTISQSNPLNSLDIDNLKNQINILYQEIGDKNQEIQRLSQENFQLKEKINVLNRKYLNAEIDSRKIDSTINNQVSSQEINRNTEISKYKELVQEQKDLIQQLQNNEHFINQTKEMAKLQQTNDFLQQRLIECKDELNNLQLEVLKQFEKEDLKSHQAEQRLKQLESIIKERDEVIKYQNIDIDKLKIIITQAQSNSNRSRQQSREKEIIKLQEQQQQQDDILEKEDLEKNDKKLLTLMNENKNLEALTQNLQTQLKNEKLVRIREQNAIQKMKEEVQNLEDQYNREINFYKSEYTKFTTEARQTLENQQLTIPTDAHIHTENNKEKEKKAKKVKKQQSSLPSRSDVKVESKTSLKSKVVSKKKEKKKQEQVQTYNSIVIPSIIMDQQQQKDNIKAQEKQQQLQQQHSQSNIFSNARLQQTPTSSTQRININNLQGTVRQQQFDQDLNHQFNYNNNNNVIDSNQPTLRNQSQLKYYKTTQQPNQQQQQQQNQQQQQYILDQPREKDEQIVNRFKHAINRIENKLERMTVDLKLNESEEEDDFKISNYYQINK